MALLARQETHRHLNLPGPVLGNRLSLLPLNPRLYQHLSQLQQPQHTPKLLATHLSSLPQAPQEVLSAHPLLAFLLLCQRRRRNWMTF